MPVEEGVRTTREAVGVFSSPETLQDSIDELLSSGFHRAELSLLASERTVEAKSATNMIRWVNWLTIRQFHERPTYQPKRSGARRAG